MAVMIHFLRRAAVSSIVLTASAFSLFASVFVLRRAKELAPAGGALLVGLCLGAVILAWLVTHTAYALRYAHLYYRDGGVAEGGLEFPGEVDAAPNYLDFAYFAFTIGMTARRHSRPARLALPMTCCNPRVGLPLHENGHVRRGP